MTVLDRPRTLTAPSLIVPNDADDLVRVFVYGTLRVGHGNFQWCSDAVRYALIDARTDGRIYFVNGTRGYPVAKFDEEGTILGDVLWFDPDHPDFADVVRMEIGAGYTCQDIIVRHDEYPDIECMGFHYVRSPRGVWIQSGDWASAW